MSQKSLTIQSWQEREALRHELAAARHDISLAAGSLRHSLNPKERAEDFIRQRPATAVMAAVAAGAVAIKILPGLLWRSKGNLLSRFTGEMMKGAAGMLLPLIAGKIAAARQRSEEPGVTVFPHDPSPSSIP
ncbi:MAG TPA: hypothetical protein VHM91_05070 [Verrucomicrobiales bacterium]|jgi:hypothetical protein|nr:hypothetical protein [Verrucomicrobiales bacterium]